MSKNKRFVADRGVYKRYPRKIEYSLTRNSKSLKSKKPISDKKRYKMDWLYGVGALVLGSGSLYFFVQQFFIISLMSFIIAVLLVYLFEVGS